MPQQAWFRLRYKLALGSFLAISLVSNCTSDPNRIDGELLFDDVSGEASGILFVNELPYTEELNPYTYKSFYNGGGVGIGDLDGDGLQDLILTGNLVDNGVYRNLGDFQFEPFSKTTGLEGRGAWSTGVTIADVNGDGLVDVYLCKSGPPEGANRRNELRINQGDGTFVDIAEAAGVDDYGLGVHAAFLDYDRDGDLDMYLLNNSIRSVGGYDIRPGQRTVRDTAGGNKLYRNELVETGQLRFEDVSEAAGIYGSDIGFGLGVSVGDVNGDGWPDLYVSNDFYERDYLYINNRVGGFAERLTTLVPETSMGAMGADMADLNGDGRPEIFVTEMLPSAPERYRSKAQFESIEKRRLAEAKGYHQQFGRNSLLVNEGGAFSERSRMHGLEATDWSWGALLFDMDTDGRRDIFVANGIYKDLLDQDYIKFVADDRNVRQWVKEGGEVVKRLIDSMPSQAVPNVAYRSIGGDNMAFVDSTAEWGLGVPSFSNGAAYGDLDNDGDLDLVINRVNQPALVYRNTSRERRGMHAITLQLVDTISLANRYAWGSRVNIWRDGRLQQTDVAPMRGFMSTVDARVFAAFGQDSSPVDSVVVEWSGGGRSRYDQLALDSQYTLVRDFAYAIDSNGVTSGERDKTQWRAVAWAHTESEHNDFSRYPLLLEMISAEGPVVVASSDAVPLLFVGAARGDQSALLLPGPLGQFKILPWPAGREPADVTAAWWSDIDGDGDEDLIVGYGGDETSPEQFATRLQVYQRQGSRLSPKQGILPSTARFATGALCAADFDGDGDQDLFVGTHFRLRAYGLPAPSWLLLNDGVGGFSRAEGSILDTLDRVRAAAAGDLDGDGSLELVVAREYGAVEAYAFAGDSLRLLAKGPTGLWRSLLCLDADGDGRDEVVAGNLGTNSRLRAAAELPLRLRIGDFDQNGSIDLVPTRSFDGAEGIAAQLGDLWQAMPALRRRVPRYASYATAEVADVLDLSRQVRELQAQELRSGALTYDGTDALSFTPFPAEAQTTTLRAFACLPGSEDSVRVFAAGNYTYVKPEYGGQSSGYGVVLATRAGSQWTTSTQQLPKLYGSVSGLAVIEEQLVAGRNSDSLVHLTLPRE